MLNKLARWDARYLLELEIACLHHDLAQERTNATTVSIPLDVVKRRQGDMK